MFVEVVVNMVMLVTISAAMRRPVRDEKDATGTHIGPHPTVGAQVLLVLTVVSINKD